MQQLATIHSHAPTFATKVEALLFGLELGKLTLGGVKCGAHRTVVKYSKEPKVLYATRKALEPR